jgi:predicted secreted Zn-dependent protease
MHRLLVTLAAFGALFAAPVDAATLKKSYSYFDIAGRTVPEIENQLEQKGPRLASTGRRHPGATRMEFNTNLKYGQVKGRCAVTKVTVRVTAKLILPRWKQKGAERDVRFIWETLSADIKRHEEQHVAIAEAHGRELDAALKALTPAQRCEDVARRANEVTDKILRKHDRAQDRFDIDEARGFEERFMRALEKRMASARR